MSQCMQSVSFILISNGKAFQPLLIFMYHVCVYVCLCVYVLGFLKKGSDGVSYLFIVLLISCDSEV